MSEPYHFELTASPFPPGAMIFAPDANQGPLLGLFITGPVRFIVGLIGGGIYWKIKTSKGNSLN